MSREDEFAELLERAGGRELSGAAAARPFAPEQLVACVRCLRANAPTRMNCLYCGAQLPQTAESKKLRRPALKKLEEWEQGFNVVLLPREDKTFTPEAIAEAASLLRLDAARLTEIIDARRALPLARASSSEEAGLVLKRLGALGLAGEVFADEELTRQPVKVRALTLEEDALVCRPGLGAGPRRVAWGEVLLLVKGRVVTKRVEVEERREKVRGRGEIVETREIAGDEAVLDIHAISRPEAESQPEEHSPSKEHSQSEENSQSETDCFRVLADNFDYSCLGASKRLLARENFVTLVETLRARAPFAVFDDEYASSRALLSFAWPPTERTASLGLRRERPGRFNTEAATLITNEQQFTRYSRLRRRLAPRGRE
ncbi:MAG TPA: hypothetical protein VE713_11055 [Pyrinomonadaceae bacterium]|nr:hypothetical protein [Pyrinomonadaceae bacterium]